jgi:toxin FitB
MLERWLDALLHSTARTSCPLTPMPHSYGGRLRVPHPENPLDKQIAATALLYELVLVTRNIRHFESTGVKLLDPFAG